MAVAFRPDSNRKKFNMFEEAEKPTIKGRIGIFLLIFGLFTLVRMMMILRGLTFGTIPYYDDGLRYVIEESQDLYKRHFESEYYYY